jgi:predicted  nucleic acid-binding Zn-ribbon protein
MAGTTKKMKTEDKLKKLYELQTVDSQIDDIKNLRGSLPLEIEEIELEVKKMQTRIDEVAEITKSLEKSISERKHEAKEAEALIKKYKEQQKNVRNNREFDSLSKEIEYQGLEIQLSEKRIKEYAEKIEENEKLLAILKDQAEDKNEDLKYKQNELKEIVNETKGDEERLIKAAEKLRKEIPESLLDVYNRIRNKVFDGCAVVKVERSACTGCYSILPAQREIDIHASREIMYCEECGRLLVSPAIDSDKTDED